MTAGIMISVSIIFAGILIHDAIIKLHNTIIQLTEWREKCRRAETEAK